MECVKQLQEIVLKALRLGALNESCLETQRVKRRGSTVVEILAAASS